jgi:hypothetical protein
LGTAIATPDGGVHIETVGIVKDAQIILIAQRATGMIVIEHGHVELAPVRASGLVVQVPNIQALGFKKNLMTRTFLIL